MNARRCEFSAKRARKAPLAAAAFLAGALGGAGLAAAADASAPPAGQAHAPADAPVPAELIQQAARKAPYPKFASIPPTPTDNPKPHEWKAEVVATRQQGAHLTRNVERLAWSLSGDTEDFGASKRAEGAPPPQITTPFPPDIQARLDALRAQASAPPRPH